MPLLTFLRSGLSFLLKYWKVILPVLVVGWIVYVIYTQKLEIADLTSDLVTTQAQLADVKKQYATQRELNAVKEDIASKNAYVLRKVTERDRHVSNALSEIEANIRKNGTDVDRLTMKLNKDVSEAIDKEIEARGYND